MKRKIKKTLLATIAGVALALAPLLALAQPSGDRQMPAENDPFWTYFAQMSRPDDTATCLAFASQSSEPYMSEFCSDIASMPTEMEGEMASQGVTSNIFSTLDWHNVQNLYFEKSGTGKIQFSNTIDFMSYRFMSFMSNFQNMVQFNDGYISLNASMVTDMKYYGTQLTMLGLDFTETPDIYVTDANGTTMHLATDSDISGVTYDPITGTLIFNASHFSAFKAVTKGSKVATMKITKVTPNKIKYNSRKSSFKITVKGKNIYKRGGDVACTLGFQQAAKVRGSANGKNVVCTFGMSSFSALGYYPLTITVAGTGEVTKNRAVRVR